MTQLKSWKMPDVAFQTSRTFSAGGPAEAERSHSAPPASPPSRVGFLFVTLKIAVLRGSPSSPACCPLVVGACTFVIGLHPVLIVLVSSWTLSSEP